MGGSPASPRLTDREREIADLVAAGLTNVDVAARLGLSDRTVDGSLQQVYRKLGVSTRQQLTAWLREREAAGLPAPLDGLIGREEDLARAAALVTAHRLVTLTGPGGVGKTRLAIQVGRAVGADFPGGVHLVELSAVNEPELVDDAVVSGFGLHLDGDRPAHRIVADRLGQRPALLVLDNCEHLVEASALLAQRLLTACPGLHVLATSREPLMVPGERVRQVAPLALPAGGQALTEDALRHHAAVRLFLERAEEAGGALPVGPGDLAVVVDICRRLDGLPLALELAAARTRAMTPAALLEHLGHDERPGILTAGYRTAGERQQTLRATVEWSHRLLSEPEQVLFARLAVFAGGFDLRSAQAVAGGEPLSPAGVVDLLSRLVDRSLVQVGAGSTGEPRYRLLDTLRAYGRERLGATGGAEETSRRHAEHHAEVLAEPMLTWSLRAAGEMREQMDDVRAALAWSLANAPELTTLICGRLVGYWGRHGPIGEGCQWMDRIIERLPADDSHRAIACANGAWLAQRHGRFDAAERYAQAELRIARAIGDTSAVADALTRLGDIARNRGRFGEAVAHAAEGVAMRRGADDAYELALALVVSGSALGRRGDHDEGRRQLEEAADLFGTIGESAGVALARGWLCEVAIRMGDLPLAAAQLAQSLRTYRDRPDAWMVANLFDLAAWLARIQDDPTRALRLAVAAAGLREAIGAAAVPALAEPVERAVRESRRWLGARAEEAWRQGVGAGPEQAITYALRETDWEAGAKAVRDAATGGLTGREREVALLIAEGLADKEIAARLGIGRRTAEHHAEQVRRKLGCSSRTQVAAWVVQHDLTPDGER